MSKDLLQAVRDNGLDEYGSYFPQSFVHCIIGISIPEVGTAKQFRELELIELGAIDYVRNALLPEGKYLSATPGGYRILLPSENKKQIEAYMRSADRKLRRAIKLNTNTPKVDSVKPDNTGARLMMKRESIRRHI